MNYRIVIACVAIFTSIEPGIGAGFPESQHRHDRAVPGRDVGGRDSANALAQGMENSWA
jgi:hypothetical protein